MKLLEFSKQFPDEESCSPYFRELRESEGVICRTCGCKHQYWNKSKSEHLGNRVSADTISSITDCVLPEIKAWKSRSLGSVYPIVFMDTIHYKVMDERGQVLMDVIGKCIRI